MSRFLSGLGVEVRSGLVIAAEAAVALAIYALVRAAGIDLEVGRGDDKDTVDALDVLIAALAGGLGAWVVHWFLARRGWLRWWPFVGSTALAISMNGPAWMADGEVAVVLMLMHLAVGIVLITGFSLSDAAERPMRHEPASR
jgi:hypothetical protein